VWLVAALLALIEVHGPTHQRIFINPREITSLREPLLKDGFARGTRCLIYLTNRNFIAVTETCDQVRDKLRTRLEPGQEKGPVLGRVAQMSE
jgi:hypothetical protein